MNYEIVMDEHQKFIDENLKNFYGEHKHFVEWMDSRSLTSKRFKKRLIVIGEYRILSVKKGKVSISLNKNIHFYDIADIIVVEDTIEIRQKQVIKGDQIGILIKSKQKESLQMILKLLREKIRNITHGFPSTIQLRINANESYLLPIEEKVIGIADNFIETYKAQSSYKNNEPSTEVIRLVEKYVQDCCREFDLSKCPGFEGKSELNFQIDTVISSLNYNGYFNSIIINGNSNGGSSSSGGGGGGGGSGGSGGGGSGGSSAGVNQKGLVEKVGELLSSNCCVRKISIFNCKDDDQVLSTIGTSLIGNQFNLLQVIDLHSNHINQSTFQTFADGIETMTHNPLRYLNLSDCNLSSRSIEILFNSFSKNSKISTTLEYLNLSYSKFDDVGSISFTSWLAKIKDDNVLKFLYLTNCSLNLIIIGAQLRNLPLLRVLDISNNRLERTEIEELIAFIKNTRALESLNISNCSLNHDYFLYICNTLNKNEYIKHLDLNVSHNQISKSPSIFVSALEFLTMVNSLNLSHIPITYKTLIRVVDSIRIYCKNIRELILDACFSHSSDKSHDGIDFINELKQFLRERESLKSLSIGGDNSNYLSSKLVIPLIEYLTNENGTLEQLNIQYSHLGDSVMPYIANLLEHNSTLKSLSFDRNYFTINSFQTLLLSLQNNHTLLNIPFPSYDFEKNLITLPTAQKKSLLFSLLYRIQSILEENGGWRIPDPHFYPVPTSSSNNGGSNLQLLGGGGGGASGGSNLQLQQRPSSPTSSTSSSGFRSKSPTPVTTSYGSSAYSQQHYENLPLPPPPVDNYYNNNNNNYYQNESEGADDDYYNHQQQSSQQKYQNRATLSPTNRNQQQQQQQQQYQNRNQRIELTDSFVEAVDHLNDDENLD
ncbi:hypothetical protein ACTFIZ_006474 [Dictyostelium cf. discoideum]